jgi:hypothetical protein
MRFEWRFNKVLSECMTSEEFENKSESLIEAT